jgi:hypothetical protein
MQALFDQHSPASGAIHCWVPPTLGYARASQRPEAGFSAAIWTATGSPEWSDRSSFGLGLVESVAARLLHPRGPLVAPQELISPDRRTRTAAAACSNRLHIAAKTIDGPPRGRWRNHHE